MGLHQYIRCSSCLSGPLARFLNAREGNVLHDDFHIKSRLLAQNHAGARIVSKTTDVVFTCVDGKYQAAPVLGARDGEITPLPIPGAIIEKAEAERDLAVLFSKFEIQRAHVQGHTLCGKMGDLVDNLPHNSGTNLIERAISISPLRGREKANLQMLAAMGFALESTFTLTKISSVAERVNAGELDIIPAFVFSEIEETSSTGLMAIRDEIAMFDPEQKRFTLPQNKSNLDEILSRGISGGSRIKALREMAKEGVETYAEAIKNGDTGLNLRSR